MQQILDFIAQAASAAIAQRGRDLYQGHRQKLQFVDFAKNCLHMKVKGTDADVWYDVRIDLSQADIATSCSCPYDWGGICKHEVAALLYLNDYLQRMPAFLRQQVMSGRGEHDQQQVEVRMPSITEAGVLQLLSKHLYQEAKHLARSKQFQVQYGQLSIVCHLPQPEPAEALRLSFSKKGDRLETSCSCGQRTETPFCVHKAGALLQLLQEKGEFVFEELRDWTAERQALLSEYGYDLADPEVPELFGFYFEQGLLHVRPNDPSVLKVEPEAMEARFGFLSPRQTRRSLFSPKLDADDDWAVGYAFSMNGPDALVPMLVLPFRGKPHRLKPGFSSHLSPIGQLDFGVMPLLDDRDRQALGLLHELSDPRLQQLLAEKGAGPAVVTADPPSRRQYDEEGLQLLDTIVLGLYHQIFHLIEGKPLFVMPEGVLRAAQLLPLDIAPKPLLPAFRLEEAGEELRLHLALESGGVPLESPGKGLCSSVGLLADADEGTRGLLYLVHDAHDLPAIRLAHAHPLMRVRRAGWEAFVQQVLLPLMRRYPVDIRADLRIQEIDGIEPEAKLFLDERDGFLMLTPLFEYDGRQASPFHPHDIVYEEDDEIVCVKRDYDYEEELLETLAQTHEHFLQEEESFFLHPNRVLENNWFFEVFELLREKGFEVLGFERLKSFRYSPHKPETVFNVTSGIDWFDCEVTVRFGDQVVSLKDVRKAVLDRKQYVKLGDGTLGILPEEWLQRYGAVLKLGQLDKNGIRLSKVHFSVVDELYQDIDNEEVLREIAYKKRRLQEFEEIAEVSPSPGVKAQLRDYQKAGLNWLGFLEEFRWGGCLADDMGLGKTLQALAFLQGAKDRRGKMLALVVTPTSLIFNWANEIEKFTPGLRYLVHHGTQRAEGVKAFQEYDVVLTSYGIVVRDIDKLRKVAFDYLVLDESQAIKNVASKRYKAVSLLRASHKLVLTGTPIENNTFELYAQMNFLNPGILGPQEFFKMEYASPIDKKGDRRLMEELKRLVYPFILRRTKEQVARDLPDKSETVLYCEMGVKQRKVYDSFKNHYRDKIMNLIEEQGLEKSGIYVLEGLLKLRQICDSPALLKDQTPHTDESVKLQELGHQLQEVLGGHKALVFSQFVGMLSLVRKQLERRGIEYCYLDGQTRNRNQVVDEFQQNPKKRVFLISLKAGGVGLNLTAADYVYLIDPWWNPAVEQQAIDRTHRIGQTQKVFAYKMICKDTVEEKILQLQQRKQALVTDIINAEQSFLKQLTKEDIQHLFS